jgi:hypothetical protein
MTGTDLYETGESPAPAPRKSVRARLTGPTARRSAKWLAIVLLVGLVIYYPVGMLLVHEINDDPEFTATEVPEGASRAVAVTAAVLDREVNRSRWTANDPFFLPGYMLDNMPNFQQGVVDALARFTIEMLDHIGRVRGSSQSDADLETAAGRLKYPGTVWVWDPTVSLAPQASSEAQYRAALRALTAYNERLAAGSAVFERRADNLQKALDRITADIGSASAVLDTHIAEHAGDFIDTQADNIFYRTEGRLYGYYLILRELQADYDKVIAERELQATWGKMLDSLRAAIALDPWVVVNGAPDSLVRPSHLTAQGFYLLRTRTQLKEIYDILQK